MSIQAQPLIKCGPPILSPGTGLLYKHSPLDVSSPGQIRLLKLLLGRGATPITCEIFHTSIADPLQLPEYEAVSYTWGKNPPSCFIHIDGHMYPVRENLCWTLYYLRLDAGPRPRVLWIDALCIDQTSDTERNHQVAQMGNIYRSANKVVASLGNPTQDSSLAFDILRRRAQQLRNAQFLNVDQMTDGFDTRDVEALVQLCGREYWVRLWIIQEVVLARDVEIHCGPEHCLWDTFRMVVTSVAILHSSAAYRVVQARQNHASLSLIELLETFQNNLCKDPRDKIYGLLGMASDVRNGELSIDYRTELYEVWWELLSVYSSKLEPRGDTIFAFATLVRDVLNGLVKQAPVNNLSPQVRPPKKRVDLLPTHSKYLGEVFEAGTPLRFQKKDKSIRGSWLDEYQIHDSTKPNLGVEIMPWASKIPGLDNARKVFSSRSCKTWIVQSSSYAEVDPEISCSLKAIFPPQPHEQSRWEQSSRSLPRLFRCRYGSWGLAPPGSKAVDIICSIEGCEREGYAPDYRKPEIFVQLEPSGKYKLLGRGLYDTKSGSQVRIDAPKKGVILHLDTLTLYDIISKEGQRAINHDRVPPVINP